VIGLLALSTSACGMPTVRQLRHQPSIAAESAEKFARVAFVEGNVKAAYDLIWEEGKRRLSVDAAARAIADINKAGRPSEVEATEYEPILGQPAMNIFLHGKGEAGDFYYRFVMMGTEDTGYRVADFFKGSGPYPPSNMRKPLH
jgi:hypothetical protein